MYSENSNKKNLVPALLGAGFCLLILRSGILFRSGFLTLFFLVPMGYISYKYDYKIAWTAALLAIFGNVLFVVTFLKVQGFPMKEIAWDIFYFSVMVSLFVWITASADPLPGIQVKISGGTRLIIGSCLGAILFTVIFLKTMASPGFMEYINSLIETLVSFYRSSGSDVVQNALLESLTAEVILETMKSIVLRGGSLVSCMFLFFISRQISIVLVRFSLKRRGGNSQEANTYRNLVSAAAFHVHPMVIWVFSASLALVVFTRIVKMEVPEVILWNILVICVIVYFTQGLGILQFFLSRPSTPASLRFFLVLIFVVLFFSPVINAILLGGIVILGIAENWVPFRVPKQNGPPSTPEAGDGGNL